MSDELVNRINRWRAAKKRGDTATMQAIQAEQAQRARYAQVKALADNAVLIANGKPGDPAMIAGIAPPRTPLEWECYWQEYNSLMAEVKHGR